MTTTLEEQASYPGSDQSGGRASSTSASLWRIARTIPWPICVVTVIAAVLRFAQLDGVSGNQFYDAAVRSMSGSVHNFFFGAFDPAAILSIDKPPLDLWLQVISVKLFGWGGFDARVLDDRKTRGGPLASRPSSWNGAVGLGNDSRQKLYFEWSVENWSARDSSWERGTHLIMTYRPTTNLKLQLTPGFVREFDYSQYVDQIADPSATATYGTRYIFSGINQHVVDLATRADWTLSSRLSMQLYLQPFLASGAYDHFTQLARPRSDEYTPYPYESNPDFDFRSLRGSAVVRWEFRPGSAFYFVWNENRADTQNYNDFRVRRDVGALRNAPSKDVFLVKVSYWLPM